MTCPKREAEEATRERSGVVYPLLPRAQRPDTLVVIEAALPEAAALDRPSPAAYSIGDRRYQPAPASVISPEDAPHEGSHANAVAISRWAVNRLPKRSSAHGRWCE